MYEHRQKRVIVQPRKTQIAKNHIKYQSLNQSQNNLRPPTTRINIYKCAQKNSKTTRCPLITRYSTHYRSQVQNNVGKTQIVIE